MKVLRRNRTQLFEECPVVPDVRVYFGGEVFPPWARRGALCGCGPLGGVIVAWSDDFVCWRKTCLGCGPIQVALLSDVTLQWVWLM